MMSLSSIGKLLSEKIFIIGELLIIILFSLIFLLLILVFLILIHLLFWFILFLIMSNIFKIIIVLILRLLWFSIIIKHCEFLEFRFKYRYIVIWISWKVICELCLRILLRTNVLRSLRPLIFRILLLLWLVRLKWSWKLLNLFGWIYKCWLLVCLLLILELLLFKLILLRKMLFLI